MKIKLMAVAILGLVPSACTNIKNVRNHKSGDFLNGVAITQDDVVDCKNLFTYYNGSDQESDDTNPTQSGMDSNCKNIINEEAAKESNNYEFVTDTIVFDNVHEYNVLGTLMNDTYERMRLMLSDKQIIETGKWDQEFGLLPYYESLYIPVVYNTEESAIIEGIKLDPSITNEVIQYIFSFNLSKERFPELEINYINFLKLGKQLDVIKMLKGAFLASLDENSINHGKKIMLSRTDSYTFDKTYSTGINGDKTRYQYNITNKGFPTISFI